MRAWEGFVFVFVEKGRREEGWEGRCDRRYGMAGACTKLSPVRELSASERLAHSEHTRIGKQRGRRVVGEGMGHGRCVCSRS